MMHGTDREAKCRSASHNVPHHVWNSVDSYYYLISYILLSSILFKRNRYYSLEET